MQKESRSNGAGRRAALFGRSRSTLANRAYAQIRDEILRGNLAIGDVLSRRKFAKILHMSFVPITEALQRLESEGLVESRPRIGTRVRIPSEEDIRGSYEIREALEAQSARLCAARMTDGEKESLKKGAEHLDRLYQAGQSEADPVFLYSVHTYHMGFHMRIAEFARCPGLSRAIEKEQVLIFNWLFDTSARRTVPPLRFHSKLAAAICSGNVLRADEAMRSHIRYGLDIVLKHFSNLEVSNAWRSRKPVS